VQPFTTTGGMVSECCYSSKMLFEVQVCSAWRIAALKT